MTSFPSLAATLTQLSTRDDQAIADDSQYGYTPQEAITILFLVLYGISTSYDFYSPVSIPILLIIRRFQSSMLDKQRISVCATVWWLFPTAVLCGLGELIGWSGRLWSSLAPTADTPFTIQISTTIIALTPLLAATFMIMSRIVERLGASYSRLTPKWYTILFLPCDIIALVVQGVGGGMASTATDLDGANVGANVMLGGIAFQFAVIVVFTVFALDFTQRYIRDRPVRAEEFPRGFLTPRLKTMLGALAFSTTVLVIRSIYRLIELSGGWTGRIIRTEVYFNVLDGGMVTLAIFTLNFVHPGLFLRPSKTVGSGSEFKL
ncbi:RTA1 like protein-domain-containing protein [Mycena olivaceomarginata]|nr:RTA1 like protein-domain-containing protein [Mycena olivaceomarginata]